MADTQRKHITKHGEKTVIIVGHFMRKERERAKRDRDRETDTQREKRKMIERKRTEK